MISLNLICELLQQAMCEKEKKNIEYLTVIHLNSASDSEYTE